jgi:hypothetical protein
MADTSDLLIAEYNAHQARYRQLTEQAVWLQNYALIYTAAIWTWALAVENPFISKLALWLPVLITGLFLAKARFLHNVVTNIYKRLAEIEGRLGAGNVGWYSRQDRTEAPDEQPVKPHEFFRQWMLGYWCLLLVGNCLMSLAGTFFFPHVFQ